MSYSSLLQMRCSVYRLEEISNDGVVSQEWNVIESGIRCFLDLNFIRAGKDPTWTPDQASAQNRAGVLFLDAKSSAIPGDRIVMTTGPEGTFLIDSAMDQAWRPSGKHHLETYVSEVNRVFTGSN